MQTTEPNKAADGQSFLTCELALNSLGEAIFNAYNKHVKENYYEPEITISFSRAGFNKALADKNAQMRFYSPQIRAQVVYGYPYYVDIDQQEDFKVNLKKR